MNETELLRRCIEGEEQAWREFLDRYRSILYGSILRTLEMRGQPRELAEDLFQDVLLKLLADDCRALRAFEGRSRTTTWLARIAINATIDATRRRKARHELEDPGEVETDEDGISEETLRRIPVEAGILEGLESRDLAERLVESLEDPDRLILRLYFYGGLREREIADLLQAPLNTVSSRKSRALEKLRATARDLGCRTSDGVESGPAEPNGEQP